MSNITTTVATKGIERFKKSRAKVWLKRNNRSTLVSRLFASGRFEAPDAFGPTNEKADFNLARLRTCLYADALYDGEARRRDVKGSGVKKDPALTNLQKLLKTARAEAVERDLLRAAKSICEAVPAHVCQVTPEPGSCPPSPVYSASPPYSPTMPEYVPKAMPPPFAGL